MTGYMIKRDPFKPYRSVFSKFDHIPLKELPPDSTLPAFMNFIICRYVLAREESGVYAVDRDQGRKVLRVSRLKKSDPRLKAEFLDDMRYSPFYYGLWSESEPVPLPEAGALVGLDLSAAAQLFNTRAEKLSGLLNGRYREFIRLEGGHITSTGAGYDELRVWLDHFNTFFIRSNDLSNSLISNGYSYDIEGRTRLSDIFLLITMDSGKVLDRLYSERAVGKDMVLPSEIKEVLALLNIIAAM